ncbi:signal recognition particle-docking protein FtsY [Ferrimonas lipolytica]|uniref:Signal recognition particle receptor FtsY n=1 Tax=Ferrimonas lipolytica TaxID=2724191 RepID=A0A6H1UI17_9GAMM|nr:signal recognition particle-docking protein FtsY [Ferrimonas lipolytica]QIZ78250.1 signal recognition particle-docking protein FtsY [Ferrimonas lipolytica]
MAKSFFSWFRRDKKAAEQTAEAQATVDETASPTDVTSTVDEAAQQKAIADAEALRQAETAAAEKRQTEQTAQIQQQAAAAAETQRHADEAAKRLAEEAEAKRLAEEAEAKRLAEEAEAKRLAEEAEAKRLAEEAEAKRLAEEAEAKRLAEEAEAKRLAEEAEAKRLAEEAEAKRLAEEVEAKRLAEEAEAKRLAEEAEAKRLAEEAEAKRLAEEAEAKRLAEEAEAKRLAEEAEAKRLAEEAEAKRLAEEAEAKRLAEEAEAKRLAEEVEAKQDGASHTAERPEKQGFFARLKAGLRRTSANIGGGFVALFRGKKIDEELFEELETQLLLADVGVETTTRIIDSLTKRAEFGELKDSDALFQYLRQELSTTLEPVNKPLQIDNANGPYVMLMVGVNGVGKTTTIGKLAKQFQAEGKSVMLAAGDTFRAAAVEQLQVWGERNDIPVIAQHTGADSASVIFDAIQAAKARNVDVLIADTAGRLQNKSHLMEELKKIVRVMKKVDENAPHEVMLTLDASTGQNAISQAQLFDEAVGLTGLTLTKLDGTAKGGVIFALADKFKIPVRYIGVGEGIDDLRPFEADTFIDALFSEQE